LQAEALQHYERGVQLNKEGRYVEAIAEFNKAIELDPKFAQAYYYRGNAHSWQGDYDKAIADYDKVIELLG